uniref:Pogo transposable element derived with ZNF domain b n=1 Tax=Tetraodon nigroviridis TaxID=99883 RepID=H3CB87_TETNG
AAGAPPAAAPAAPGPSTPTSTLADDLAAPGPSPPITSVASSNLPKVVMSVDDFYYGTFQGDLSLRKTQLMPAKTCGFTCLTCSYLAENNLRLMQHMLQHSALVGEKAAEDRNFCRFCYRQFSSSSQLQNHQEQVHGPAQSASMCRICEWAFETEPVFLSHMKSNHKPGEMPYVCQVCSFRSSFYSDVLRHFASFHTDSRFLLCVFCLKVNRNPVSYQQHLLRHQVNQAFHCNRCRLQFVFLKDKMQHKLDNHRSFRRPVQLEGLPPGSKVTIRTYKKVRPPATSRLQSPSSLIQPISIKTEPQTPLIQTSLGKSRPSLSPPNRPQSRRVQASRTSRRVPERLRCVECGTFVSDFSAHYPSHVHCLLCPYSSCCSRAYAAHMIHHHVPPSKDKVVALHRVPPPCMFLLQCSTCGFRPWTADHMATHLRMNPEHYSATCRVRSKAPLWNVTDGEEEEPADDFLTLNPDSSGSAWKSAKCWERPGRGNTADSCILPFVRALGGGASGQTRGLPPETVWPCVGDALERHKRDGLPVDQRSSGSTGHRLEEVADQSSGEVEKERDDSLNARQLRIALFALCEGLHQASRSFSTDTRLIRLWLKEARKCFTRTEQEQAANADGSERMVAWVLSMREQQLPITESNLFHKASTLRKRGTFSDSFRISYDWAVGFMLQHRLGTQSIFKEASLARRLPPFLQVKVESFQQFTKQVIQVKKLPESLVAAMDELCLFVDLRVVQDKARCSEALELTGSVPLVTVYLAVLANGTMLPSLVMTNRTLAQKRVPEFMLLQDGADSLLVEEVLELWTSKVWIPHVSRPAQPQKSMLVLDRHREHLRDSFLTSISGAGTLPAMVPGGCSFRLQPLEVCLKPVLKFFLLSRWAQLTSGNPKELQESSPQQLQANVAQILVDWVTEALTHMNKLPELWRRSFHLADLLPRNHQMGREVDGLTNQKPGEVQSDLIKTLTETLLGPEALADISTGGPELEDEESTEEE